MGKTKLKISESQFNVITNMVNEDIAKKNIIRQVGQFLDSYYEPSYGTHKEDTGEYKNTPMVLNKVDDELITAKSLLRYLKEKFDLGPEFLAQIVRDWYDGQLDGEFMLSKNVLMDK